jgi:hypothetical protein
VILARNAREFTDAFERIAGILESPDVRQTEEEQDRYIQVESFIPGREFAIEGIVTGGTLRVHAIFDKPDDMNGPFFEETIYTTPSRECESTQRRLVTATETAVRALGLTHGPIHAEMRRNADGVWMLEVAARPIGGLCAKSLRFNGETSLEELILLHAIGRDISAAIREPQAAGVYMIPVPENGIYRGVSGTDEAAAVPHIWSVDITAKEGQRVSKLPEGSTYLGFLFARADTPAEVEEALRRAHALLKFDIVPDLPVLPPGAGAGAKTRVA